METPDVYGQRESYDDIWDDFSQSNFRVQQHLKNRILTISGYLSKINLNSPSILEAGCGFGVISTELFKYSRVTGVNLSPKEIEIAHKPNPELSFFHSDVLNYDSGDKKYDIVVNTEVIEHTPVGSREHSGDSKTHANAWKT